MGCDVLRYVSSPSSPPSRLLLLCDLFHLLMRVMCCDVDDLMCVCVAAVLMYFQPLPTLR